MGCGETHAWQMWNPNFFRGLLKAGSRGHITIQQHLFANKVTPSVLPNVRCEVLHFRQWYIWLRSRASCRKKKASYCLHERSWIKTITKKSMVVNNDLHLQYLITVRSSLFFAQVLAFRLQPGLVTFEEKLESGPRETKQKDMVMLPFHHWMSKIMEPI